MGLSRDLWELNPLLPLQFQMTFHLFIAAFVGAAATLVSLVSRCSHCPAVLLHLARRWGQRTMEVVGTEVAEPELVSFSDNKEVVGEAAIGGDLEGR